MQPRSCQEGERSRESACLQYAFTPLAGARRRQRRTRNMVHGKNRIPYRIDRRLTGLAGPDYDATISFGLPLEPEDSQYGKSRVKCLAPLLWAPTPSTGIASTHTFSSHWLSRQYMTTCHSPFNGTPPPPVQATCKRGRYSGTDLYSLHICPSTWSLSVNRHTCQRRLAKA